MIVLWVIVEHLWLLSVLEIPDQVVDSEFFSPFLVGNKPVAYQLSAPSFHEDRVAPSGDFLAIHHRPCEVFLHLLAQLDIEFPSSQKSEES